MDSAKPRSRINDNINADESRPAGSWSPVRATPAPSKIVRQIREALFKGRLRPGDFLGSEMELARQFDVSRITVRDALRTLEATGIVEIRVGAGGGARVARGNPERYADALAIQLKLVGVSEQEMVDAQLAIESVTAELAARHADAKDLGQLSRLLEEATEQLDHPARFTESSLAFHFAVAEASHNRALVAQLKALRHLLQAAYTSRTTREIAERVLQIHRSIYERIQVRDGAGAASLMRHHLTLIRDQAFSTGGEGKSAELVC